MRQALIVCLLSLASSGVGQGPPPNYPGLLVKIVATASEYIPNTTTFTHPGHSYTNCVGSTSYFGSFHTYGSSGNVSGSADSRTNCETTYTPPTETTLTNYRKVNYTIAAGTHGLYLLSCTQTWKPSRTARGLAAVHGVLAGAGGHQPTEEKQAQIKASRGAWSECPAFGIDTKYVLTVNNTSDAQLSEITPRDSQESKAKNATKLEYLGSASLPVLSPAPSQTHVASNTERTKVHIISTPSNGEIYIDGKFFGNTPSDVTLSTGEHLVKVTLGGKEWSRALQITSGEITVHADIPAEK